MTSTHSETMSALILAGAVAKGAFEAGVIETLVQARTPFSSIVGTSAGALSGVLLACALRGRRELAAAAELVDLWQDEARLTSVVDLSVPGILGARGLADEDKLLALLREHVKPVTIAQSERRPVDLTIVTAPLRGVPTKVGKLPVNTYEKAYEFKNEDFDTPEGLERIFQVAVASAAFPGLFVPKQLPEVGPCIDGGIVNNTPVAHALHRNDVERVFVAMPVPLEAPEEPSLRGLGLLSHVVEVLIDERFYRDLRTAYNVNDVLLRLEALEEKGALTQAQRVAVLDALGWRDRRKIELIQIRPLVALEGSAFSGFVSGALRRKYVQSGREAAKHALSVHAKARVLEAVAS